MIRKKAQFKIQEMAFVLVAVIVLFGIIFLFFARFELNNVTKTSNELREERAITLVRTVASMPELRCSERVSESVCLDLDKVKAFNSSSSLRLNYKKIWTSSYVTEVAVQNVFDTRQTYYIYQESHGNESYFSFMPLCSEDNCTIARLIIGIRTEK